MRNQMKGVSRRRFVKLAGVATAACSMKGFGALVLDPRLGEIV